MEIDINVDVNAEQLAIEVADNLDGYEDVAKFVKIMDDYCADYECTERIIMGLLDGYDDIDSSVRIINTILDTCQSKKHIKYLYEEGKFKLHKVVDE